MAKSKKPAKQQQGENIFQKIGGFAGEVAGTISVKKDKLMAMADNAIQSVKTVVQDITDKSKTAKKATRKPVKKVAKKVVEKVKKAVPAKKAAVKKSVAVKKTISKTAAPVQKASPAKKSTAKVSKIAAKKGVKKK